MCVRADCHTWQTTYIVNGVIRNTGPANAEVKNNASAALMLHNGLQL